MAGVVLEHVEKRYERDRKATAPSVIRDLSLEVRDHELLVLVGPSGCGKSTVLRMIAGLEEATAGTLHIGARCVNGVAPKDRDVAMVFQSYALYPHMTCFDNMAFALTLRRVPRQEIRERVLAAARALAIEPLLARRPRELSGGQRQRVAIGRAIVRSPSVFLMDEPLSNLDAKLRVSMRAEIKRLHEKLAATIVYVTHDQTEAMTLGDRIAVLRAGELMQCDAPAALHARPANAFVGAFIGSPEMNLIAARRDEGHLTGPGFSFPLPGPAHGDVLVGIRPEHLAIVDANADADSSRAVFRGRAVLVESTGSEAFVHVETEAGRLVAKASPSESEDARPHEGETLGLGVDGRWVHLFDRATEARLE
jgi:multiple sugar transport system ATP-binding protein